MLFAEVAVDALILEPKTYTYSIPKDTYVSVGQMVQVPLRNQFVDGIVTNIKDSIDLPYVKSINKSDEQGPLLDDHQIYLAQWMSDYYFTSFYSCLSLMIPPSFTNRSQQLIKIDPSIISEIPKDLLKHFDKNLVFRGKLDKLKNSLSTDLVKTLNQKTRNYL